MHKVPAGEPCGFPAPAGVLCACQANAAPRMVGTPTATRGWQGLAVPHCGQQAIRLVQPVTCMNHFPATTLPWLLPSPDRPACLLCKRSSFLMSRSCALRDECSIGLGPSFTFV